MYIGRWTGTEDMVHIHNGTSLSHKKNNKSESAIVRWMNLESYTEWSEKEKNIIY